MTIFEDFLFWVMSIVEDDPMPDEVHHIYFVINFRQGDCALSLTGTELFENPVFNFEFYPLEAYYFKNRSYNNIKDIYIAKITVLELIEKAFENSNFKNAFKNRSIYICEYGHKIDYTFQKTKKIN